MSDKQVIDFDSSDVYELGDTHMTIPQIAEEVDLCPSTVWTHVSEGQLAGCTRVRVCGANGGCTAIEYDSALHAFLQADRKRPLDKEKIAEMGERMSVAEIAERTGHHRNSIYRLLRRTSGGVQWGRWRRKANAYARQCKAQSMHTQGYDKWDIADRLCVGITTINRYLRGTQDKPDVPPGRTPPWEQDASEHGLWPTE